MFLLRQLVTDFDMLGAIFFDFQNCLKNISKIPPLTSLAFQMSILERLENAKVCAIHNFGPT